MGIVSDWLHNPEASATLLVAAVAGTWAFLQFRPIARERRRETYAAMTEAYSTLQAARKAAVPRFPPLLAAAQRRLHEIVDDVAENAGENAARRAHAEVLRAELASWSRHGIAFTSADEVLRSEAKFRALLWSVETIRAWRRAGHLDLDGERIPAEVLEAADTLAHDFNGFLFHYETGGYPARQTLGLLHRSLAVASKAVEPLIWERSLNGRWGRRVLRIGLASQHFNDVTPLHCTSEISWSSAGGRQLVHPRVKKLVLGSIVPARDAPAAPRLVPAWRYLMRVAYWYGVGVVSPRPRFWWLSYGGTRLRRHRRRENELAGLLSVALERTPISSVEVALALEWDLASLRDEQRTIVRAELAQYRRFGGLWTTERSSDSSRPHGS